MLFFLDHSPMSLCCFFSRLCSHCFLKGGFINVNEMIKRRLNCTTRSKKLFIKRVKKENFVCWDLPLIFRFRSNVWCEPIHRVSMPSKFMDSTWTQRPQMSPYHRLSGSWQISWHFWCDFIRISGSKFKPVSQAIKFLKNKREHVSHLFRAEAVWKFFLFCSLC